MSQDEKEVLNTQFEGLLQEYAAFFAAEQHGCMPSEKLEAFLERATRADQEAELKAEFGEILTQDSERARDLLGFLRSTLAQAQKNAEKRHRTTYHPLNPLDEILKDHYRDTYHLKK